MDALEIMFGKRSIADKIKRDKEEILDKVPVSLKGESFEDCNSDLKDAIRKPTSVNCTGIKMNKQISKLMKKRFISFDTETTGFSSDRDRIIEIGAVLFEDGVAVRKIGTLINAGKHVPVNVSKINHITDDMLIDAPKEEEAYTKFIKFIGDAIYGDTIICAHNAKFDMRFLNATFERLRIGADIRYVDTLTLSKGIVQGLDNYKQTTLANYFGIEVVNAHRADADAYVCGQIMIKLLEEC